MPAPERAVEIKAMVAALVAFLTALWGWLGWEAIIWVACMGLDFASGSAAARRTGEWSSEKARDGRWHKAGELFTVIGAGGCDIMLYVLVHFSDLHELLGFTPIVTPVVLAWYIITELGSILENAERMGAPVPTWLKKGLKQYREKIDKHQEQAESEK